MDDSGKRGLNLDASGGTATFGGGNIVVSVRERMRDGVKLWVKPIATAVVRRTRARARGTGCRPKAQATASRRGGDSGDEDGESGEPPLSGRLCEFCGGDIRADRSPLAAYCSDRHADRDRQRRNRDRDKPGGVVARLVVWRCTSPLELEEDHCTKCGRSLRVADRLEELVRRPLQPRRAQLLDLADRLRGLEERGEQLALDLEEAA
jgi:hypothetical protein